MPPQDGLLTNFGKVTGFVGGQPGRVLCKLKTLWVLSVARDVASGKGCMQDVASV